MTDRERSLPVAALRDLFPDQEFDVDDPETETSNTIQSLWIGDRLSSIEMLSIR